MFNRYSRHMPPARISGPISGFGADYYRDSSISWGLTYNRNSGSTYNRLTCRCVLMTPIVLSSILWDIYAAGTYKVSFVNSSAASPSDLLVLAAAQSMSNGANTIQINPPIFLLPGKYYLSIYISSLKSMADNSTGSYDTDDLILDNNYYDGVFNANYHPPIRLVGNKISISNLSKFQPSPI